MMTPVNMSSFSSFNVIGVLCVPFPSCSGEKICRSTIRERAAGAGKGQEKRRTKVSKIAFFMFFSITRRNVKSLNIEH